ncbi:DUF4860 domain-containing protein [Arabiibacter massiliensis]|uniref:DUF4860 domain-containing protein n=1 Tax=Arabiibacter massiliensis TaxID=1870985 RepID=UPI0009BC2F65|nr:DUF4860 domain-containing protein [Arabiibacter massiliensis]
MEALTSRGIARRAEGGQGFGRLFTVLLFALFVVALLIAIMAGTGLYRALVDVRDAADSSRLATGLIANSVRAADAVDAVGAGQGPEGRSLVLTERLDSGTFETRIYAYQGFIVEEYALDDAPYTPEKATRIVASERFAFSYENGLLVVQTDDGDASIALRSVKGGA